MDYDAVMTALRELAGREVVVAIQFTDRSLDPIAVLTGQLAAVAGEEERFEVGDSSISVRREDLVDGDWVDGLGEEPGLRFDLQNVQVTVTPASPDMADLVE